MHFVVFFRRMARPLLASAMLFAPSARAMDAEPLFELSLEELMNVQVTTASLRPQSIRQSASSVFVISADDIRRLGLRSLPEAIRLAPGMAVFQLDSSTWSVGARGSGGRFSNKLLVLQDGRPIYTPTFSGVEWDAQATFMEQIERIEVVRGPGAAVWGTNAVAGVVNVITRRADAGQAPSLSVGSDLAGGEHASAAVDFALSDRTDARAFLHHESPRAMHARGPGRSNDDWSFLRGGLRVDRGSDLTLIGEAYAGDVGRNYVPGLAAVAAADEFDGAFLLARGQRSTHLGETQAQLSVDLFDRESALYDEDRTAVNAELRQLWSHGRQDFVAGLLYRSTSFQLAGAGVSSFPPVDRRDEVFSAFGQDEISFADERLRITLGLRLERNDLSDEDYEWMPSARALFELSDAHVLWAAYSRAVRTPSVGEASAAVLQNFDLEGNAGAFFGPITGALPVPVNLQLVPNPALGSETLDAYELGLRGRLGARLGYELTGFAFRYDDVRSVAPGAPVCLPGGALVPLDPGCLASATSVVVDLAYGNDGRSEVDGLEVAVDLKLAGGLLLRGSYTHTTIELDATAPAFPGEVPTSERLGNLSLSWQPREDFDAALWLRYADASDFGPRRELWQARAHIAWRPRTGLELSLTGQNLLGSRVVEGTSELGDLATTGISRTAYLQARLEL